MVADTEKPLGRIRCRVWVELNSEGKKYSSLGRRRESCIAMEVGGSMQLSWGEKQRAIHL